MKTPFFPPSSRSAELRRASKKLFRPKILLIILVCLLIFNVWAVPRAQAQFQVHDLIRFTHDVKKVVVDTYKTFLKKYIAAAFKAALKQYTQQIAYKLALDVAYGNRGQKPLYYTKPMDEFLKDVGDQALGQFMTDLSKSWGARFNVCEPSSIQIKMQIHMTLFKERKPADLSKQGICKWSEIKKNWKKWTYDVQKQPSKLYGDLRESLKPEESDAGIYLTLHSTLLSKEQEKKANEALMRQINQDIKSITSPITASIKTPSIMLRQQLGEMPKWASKLTIDNPYTGEVIDTFITTFSNTLLAHWQKQLFQKGFDVADQASSIAALNLNLPTQGSTAQAAAEQFAALATVEFSSGQQNIIDLLALPSSNPLPNALPGPTSAVVDESFVTAIKAKMTLREAMAATPKLIDGTKPFGFLSNKTAQPDYLSGYPYRSLVILRTHRIIPVGWELAALYYKQYGETTVMNFNYLISCFEDPDFPDNPRMPLDCREDTNGNGISPEDEDSMSPTSLPLNERDFNPYYHLVDPNWVLKSPQTICNRQGPGPEIIFDELQCTEDNITNTKVIDPPFQPASGPYCEADSSVNPTNSPDIPVRMVQRKDDYCGDWQSCLLEDESGACQVYGYCVKEKPIWRFLGDECPAYYNSCETFTNTASGQQYSYLRDTLKSCYQNEAGCLWYSTGSLSTTTGNLVWSATSTERVYLNNQAEICQASNAGCSKLTSLEKGVNLAVNGSFEEAEDGLAIFTGLPTTTSNQPLDWEIISNLSEDNGVEGISATTSALVGSRVLLLHADNFTGVANAEVKAVTKGYIPIDPSFTYQATIAFKSDNTTSTCGDSPLDPCERARVAVIFYERQDGLGLNNFDDIDNNAYVLHNWWVNTSTWETKTKIFRPAGATLANGENSLPSWAHYAKFFILGPLAANNGQPGTVWYDNAQLTIIGSPIVKDNQLAFTYEPESYYQDYTQSGAYTEYLKVPPEHLNCEAYNTFLYGADYDTAAECQDEQKLWRSDLDVCASGGNTLCAVYTNTCSSEEVGCLGYTPLRGGPTVPARAIEADVCPAECNGYDSYLELVNYFEEIENPGVAEVYQHFIPPSAQVCPAQDAGCEQFTNLDEVAKGGEGLEYFTYLRQCISQTNPNIATYYTWEGSDTTGYQLKKWSLLQSNLNSSPCTNITIGTENCIDTTATQHTCTYPSSNLNCRDFFNAQGEHFSILQQYAVTASGECHPYRRTISGQIYNADPTEGITCAPASNNCREYKGNTGNNIREVIHLDFSNGTFGSVTNSEGGGAGLTPSNEAVYQNDYSLRVAVNDHTIQYPLTGELTLGKQYKLSFWAKKSQMTLVAPLPDTGTTGFNQFKSRLTKLFGKKAQAQTSPTLLEFSQSYLTNEWQVYTLGPLAAPDVMSNTAFLKLTINNLSSSEGFYLDNLILEEYAQNFYVIKDSWQTPAFCDQPYLGAQLGCLSYKDTENATQYLKSFDYICQASSIGCRAFINSQNSLLQASEDYFGTCDDYVGEIQGIACANLAVPGPSDGQCCAIRGIERCNVAEDEDSCQYENITVSNDAVVYLVDDLEKTCNATQVGCQMVGKPTLNRQNDYYTGGDYETYLADYIEGFTTEYIINNPDQYGGQLCSESGLFCTVFNGDPYLTSLGYYFDPLAMGAATTTQAGEIPLGRTCYYDSQLGLWKKSGTVYTCTNNQFMPQVNEENYSGWVGLCTSQNSTCTEYRDPEQPTFEKAEECDALISPQMSGLCGDEASESYVTVVPKTYCQKTINGVTHKVCEVLGNIPCPYTENDWTCTLENVAGEDGAYCYIPDSTTGKKVCYVSPGQSSCIYSLACESYYYKHKTVETCQNGIIDRNAGCLMFNDTSQSTTTLSSDLTVNGQAPQAPTEGCSNLFYENDCDANTQSGLVVEKDRVCAENLFCSSSLAVAQEGGGTANVCLALARCKKLNPANPASCLEFVVNQEPIEQTYNFLDASGNPLGVETIRNLSGFSKAGLAWSDDKEIAGYYEAQDMSQLGENVAIINGDMEEFTDNKPDNWIETSRDEVVGNPNNCDFIKDNNNPHGGTYSLKLTANYLYPATPQAPDEAAYWCSVQNVQNENLYPVNPSENYLLSLYARSQNQAQRLSVNINFYDSGGTWLSGQGRKIIEVIPANNWTRYTGLLDSALIPSSAVKFKIDLETANTYLQQETDAAGSLWIDDVQVETALEVGEGQFAAKECRLYPKDSAPSCEYTDQQTYRGWTGYCLEFDPNGSGACLSWYPVDGISGESLTALGQEATGYDGPKPLYYCLQSAGNYKMHPCNQDPSLPECDFWDNNAPMYLYDTSYNGYKWATTEQPYDSIEGYHEIAPYPTLNIQTNFHFNYPLMNYGGQNVYTGATANLDDLSEFWNLSQEQIKKIEVLTVDREGDEQYPPVGPEHAVVIYPSSYYVPSENSYFFAYCNGSQTNTWNDGCDSSGDVKAGIKIYFDNSTKKINQVDWYQNDADGIQEDDWTFKLVFYLRETCPYIAQVVDSSGNEKVWYSHYNNAWPYNVSNLNTNGLNSGNQMGYIEGLDFYPYGAALPGSNLEPQGWSLDNYEAPLNIYQESPQNPINISAFSSGGLPISVPLDHESPGRMCLGGIAPPDGHEGESCKTSADCDDGGICMGVGGFCYNGSWNSTTQKWQCQSVSGVGDDCDYTNPDYPPNTGCPSGYYCDAGVTNGTRCDSDSDCLDEEYDQCLVPPNLPSDLPTALTRLETLFAKVYNVWKWNGTNYEECDYTSCSWFDDDTKDIIQEYDDANSGIKPQVGNIKVNGITGNVTLTAPGQMVELSFTTDVNDNLLPIEQVKIKWYDTGSDVESFDSAMMDQPNPANPHKISHLYTCIPNSEGDRCSQCWNGTAWVDALNDSCTYIGPSIAVQDHWGLCSVTGYNGEGYCDPITDGVQYLGLITIEPANQ